MTHAVVLLSGGVDSTTACTLACQTHTPSKVHGLSFLYGQKHSRELKAARDIAAACSLRSHTIIHLPDVFTGGNSALTGSGVMPEATYEELEREVGPSPTYVPFRNGVFISLAAAVALRVIEDAHDTDAEVWFGAHAGDAHNWAYPDCTPEFIGGMAGALYVGSYHTVRLVTPFQWATKADIVKLGLSLKAPYHLTWSCYEGREVPCGTCPTCRSRAQAFALAGVPDPLLSYAG